MWRLAFLARRAVRGRLAVLGGLALLVALGLGTAIAALTAAWRTEHAYPDYLRDAAVSELVVNPSVLTERIVELISSTPGVVGVTMDSLLVASPDDGAPRTRGEVDSMHTQVRASADGRYIENDRPVVHEGRMIEGGAEAFLSTEAAAGLGVGVGDVLPIAFWQAENQDLSDADPAEIVEPIGKAEVRVVGIGVFADEVLADELYPRQRVLVPHDVVAPFDCTPRHPDEDSLAVDELTARLVPPGCSLSYRYFSLRVDGGDAGVSAVTKMLTRLVEEENARLPAALRSRDVGFYLIPAVTTEESSRVQRSLDPSVTALRLFGLAAGASILALSALGAARLARRAQGEAQVWHQLGATRGQRVAAVSLPIAAGMVAGVVGAVVVGWLASGIGPVGRARLVDASPGLVVLPQVVVPVVAVALLVLAAGTLVASVAAARVTPPASRVRPSQTAARAARTGNVALGLGVRAAVTGPGAPALLGASVAAVVAVLGSVVFSTNISGLIATPARFGWPYDAAVIVGAGYAGANQQAIADTLDRPEVEAWGVAALGAGTVEDEAQPIVAARRGFDNLPVAVVEGALPVGDAQVALGAQSAERLGVGIGDQVTVATTYGARTGTISGLVVLPPLGPFVSDRAGLGTGALLPAPFFEQAVAPAEEAAGLPAGTFADAAGSFVAIDLRDGVDPRRFMSDIADGVPGWDDYGWVPFVHTDAVRPAQIADVAAMRSAPVLLAALVALAMAGGLALAIGLAVRTRRRELAILKALGSTGGQVRATLRWQALTVAVAGLVAGAPLGLALGMTAWREFAGNLGIPSAPVVSVPWIAVVVVAAVVVALLASTVPGQLAARISPSSVLRDQ
ncbi:MAG: FtsX-like permease family protein [Jiangellaceae bacterium]